MAFWAVAIALTGPVLAWLLYVRKPGVPGWLAEKLSGLYRALFNKYYVDEFYDAVIVRPLVVISDRVLFRIVDAGLIDGIGINGTARGVRAIAANGHATPAPPMVLHCPHPTLSSRTRHPR